MMVTVTNTVLLPLVVTVKQNTAVDIDKDDDRDFWDSMCQMLIRYQRYRCFYCYIETATAITIPPSCSSSSSCC